MVMIDSVRELVSKTAISIWLCLQSPDHVYLPMYGLCNNIR